MRVLLFSRQNSNARVIIFAPKLKCALMHASLRLLGHCNVANRHSDDEKHDGEEGDAEGEGFEPGGFTGGGKEHGDGEEEEEGAGGEG